MRVMRSVASIRVIDCEGPNVIEFQIYNRTDYIAGTGYLIVQC